MDPNTIAWSNVQEWPFAVLPSAILCHPGFMKITVSLWTYFKCDCANHRLIVDGGERCRRTQVGLVGGKIGTRPPLTKVSSGEPHPRLTRAHVAQGGVTLGSEQGTSKLGRILL